MSKDKIHIDKLFNQLKGKTYPTDPAGFDDIKNKLNDQAWAGKFKDYQHSNTPGFDALPIAVADNNQGGKIAKGIILSIITLLFLGSGIWVGSNFYNNKEDGNIKAKTQNLTKEIIVDIPSETNEEFNKPISEATTKPATEIKNNAPIEILDKSNKEETSKLLGSATVNANKNKVVMKATLDVSTNSSENQTKSSQKPSIEKASINNTNLAINPIENKQQVLNPQIINLGNEEFSSFEGPVGVNPLLNINLSARKYLVNLAENMKVVQEKEKPNHLKLKIPFTPYIALGMGLQTAQNQFAHTQGSNGAAWEILLGLEKGRSNFYTGFSKGEYNFLTTQKRINIHDSFPHKNANGDTIGWFKRNFRDTTFNTNDMSSIKIASIPLHFQFKVLQYKRFDFAFGAGFNFNLYKQAKIYGRDDNNYSVVYPATSPIIKRANITAGFNTRIGYRITPFTAFYLKVETFSGQNISKINTFDIKPNGTNIKIGLQRFIR